MWRRIKKALVQDPIISAAPLQTKLDQRPVSKTLLDPQGFSLSTAQKIAFGILVIPTALLFVYSLVTTQWVLVGITGVILLLVGLMLWIIRLRAQMVWKVTWYEDAVEVEDGRYGPSETWTEPLTSFRGIERDFALLPSSGRYGTGRKVWGLLLAHADPFKSVLLHADYQAIEQDTISYYANQLGKEFLES